MRLTDIVIRNLPTPEKGQAIYRDDTLAGFGVRVSQGGAKTYVLIYGKDRRQITFGRFGVVSLAEARDLARRHMAERLLNGHRPRTLTFEEARTAFLDYSQARNRPSTFKGYKSRLDRVDWGKKNLADISPSDVLATVASFVHPMEKRYAFVVLRSFFNFCIQNHFLEHSPVDRLKSPQKNLSRERVLSPEELKAIWHACPDDAFGTTVKLLMLTGQRRGEIEHLTLDGDLATLSAQFAKNMRLHTFPVPGLAANLFQTLLKWGGWGKSKARLDRVSKVANWTLHDLRRTYATIHAELGTPPHIIEALLNHRSGIISGVASTYNRYRYLPEMREAVSKFEIYITKVIA